VGSVKKKKLFERSEFFFFSFALPYFSKTHAALTFCFFCVKAKEKAVAVKAKEKAVTVKTKAKRIILKRDEPF